MPKLKGSKPEAKQKRLPARKNRNQSPRYTKADLMMLPKSIKKQTTRSSKPKKPGTPKKTASPGITSTPMSRSSRGNSKILVTPIPKSKARIQLEKQLSQEFDSLKRTQSPTKSEPPIWFQSFQQEFRNYKTNVERKLEFLIQEIFELKQNLGSDSTIPDEDQLF